MSFLLAIAIAGDFVCFRLMGKWLSGDFVHWSWRTSQDALQALFSAVLAYLFEPRGGRSRGQRRGARAFDAGVRIVLAWLFENMAP
jgi:hypothetical protein